MLTLEFTHRMPMPDRHEDLDEQKLGYFRLRKELHRFQGGEVVQLRNAIPGREKTYGLVGMAVLNGMRKLKAGHVGQVHLQNDKAKALLVKTSKGVAAAGYLLSGNLTGLEGAAQ